MIGIVRNVMLRGDVVEVATEDSAFGRAVSRRRNGWIVFEFQTELFAHKQPEFMCASLVQVDVHISEDYDMHLVVTYPLYNIYEFHLLRIIGHKIRFKEIPHFETARTRCDKHRSEYSACYLP